MFEGGAALSLTIREIQALVDAATDEELPELASRLRDDERAGVRRLLDTAMRRAEKRRAEAMRIGEMYAFEDRLAAECGASLLVGLDEVGRGPLAGPLAVGAVVLPRHPHIARLNDSKQVAPAVREEVARQVKETAVAWAVAYVEPAEIDAAGMTASLRKAFRSALAAVEERVPGIGLVLVDGNPLGIDSRERNVVKGDGKCASIAAASIVAKVERDRLMDEYGQLYPEYGFSSNKGYGSAAHEEAIRACGLSPVHRATFCSRIIQPSLFD